MSPLESTLGEVFDCILHGAGAYRRVLSQRGATYPVDYFYDEFGDKISMTTYRDVNAASDGGVAYTYDAAGNRMTRMENGITVTYTLGVGDQLASWTGGAYTHDVAGNVTRIERDGRPTLDLAWNSQYQLVSVSTNGVFAEGYAYDALGRRASTTTLDGTTRHVYDASWQVIADLDEQNNVIASYTWGDGIDNLLAVKVGSASYYPLTDVQGTVWGYVDSRNNVVARWRYDAWGKVVDESVSVPELASLRYRFQCREWSAATGLVNFRMRWYDPETGRWLSKDPIGLKGGLNSYVFCNDNMLNFRDPLGLCVDDDGKISIAEKIKRAGRGAWNFIKALPSAFMEAVLPSTSGTVFGGLEGVPTGSALGNEIKAYHDAMESLQSGGLESGDPGNVLRDSENAVRQNASAIDDAMNL